MKKNNSHLKVKLLATIGFLFSCTAAINAEDVKVISKNDSLSITNGKIRLELKKSDTIKFSSINSKAEAGLDISFLDKTGKQKRKAARWCIEKDTSAESVISVYSENPEKILTELTIKKDSEYIVVSPGRDIGCTLLGMKSQISVLPDMLAEDYIYFPEKIKNECRIPTDAYCIMNLMNDGNSMSTCLWTTDDTKVYLGKNNPENKTIDYNIIESGKLKNLYIGILSAPGIWHTIKETLNNESFTKVDWKVPFNAQWLITMKLNGGLMPINNNNFDTWIIPERINDDSAVTLRHGIGMRQKDIWNVWASLHGTFVYPFYLENNVLLARVPASKELFSYNPDYPSVIYTYKYGKSLYFDEKSLPKNQPILPYDKLTELLPYRQIFRVTAVRSQEDTYPATCGVTAEILRYFKDDQAQIKKDLIIKQIDLMNKFVDSKDKRFNDYRNWSFHQINELKKISDENKKLKPIANEIIEYFNQVEKNYADVKETVKTPAESAALAEKYIELIENKKLSPEQKEVEVDKLGREIRTMGGARDHLVAEMRLTVKSIRFHLADKLTGKLTSDEEDLIVKCRKECGDILWLKHGHEGK